MNIAKFFTITAFSKWLAIFLFIFLPFFGFFLGVKYQEKLGNINNPPLPIQKASQSKEETFNLKKNQIVVEKNGRYAYKVILFDTDTNLVFNTKTIDLTILGWDVEVVSEFFYNPRKDEIVFVLARIGGGIAGNKPKNVFPDPPFVSAVYSVSLSKNTELQKIIELDEEYRNTAYDTKRNILYLNTVLGLSIDNKSFVKNVSKAPTSPADGSDISYGKLSLTGDENLLVQKFYYQQPQDGITGGVVVVDLEKSTSRIVYSKNERY